MRLSKSKAQITLIGIAALLLGLVIILLLKNRDYFWQLRDLQQRNAQLSTEIDNLRLSIKKYEKQLENRPGLQSWDIERLRRRGLSDPVKDIVVDLMKHRELIPYEGTLGGTMGFYYPDNVWVLTNKWVLASFEDGHMGGYMFLQYKVSENGKISWTVIDSSLE